MEEKVELNNRQINAIIAAAYALTNKLGAWFLKPDEDGDEKILAVLSLVQQELQALIAACPDMEQRQHTADEINMIIARSLAFMSKTASSFPSVDRIPELFRSEIKSLYWALNDAGLIEARE